MAKRSSSGIKAKLNQVGLVVKDVRKVAENYWNILGIGPWNIMTMRSPDIYGKYGGKPAYFGLKVGLVQVGPLELELMEPLEGPSCMSDFLADYGEGVQHLQYTVGSADELGKHIDILVKNGFPLIMDGYVADNGRWAFVDTTSHLKVIWEAVKYPDNFTAPTVRFPADPKAVSPARIKVKAINRISLSVKNIEKVTKSFEEILGIGSWEIFDIAPPKLHGYVYQGKPGDFSVRAALTKSGKTELELIQPLSGDSVHTEQISKHGEGVNHLSFTVDNMQKTIEVMEGEGFPVLQSGHALYEGYFSYFDTLATMKVILEAWELPKAGAKVGTWADIDPSFVTHVSS